MVIVPNEVDRAIRRALDKAIQEFPEPVGERDREALYDDVLQYFDEHGTVPDFSLQRVLTHKDLP